MPLRRRPLLIGLLALLAVLVTAEVGARLLGPHLPEPDPWGDEARAVKAAQMDAVTGPDGPGCVDVVVAGDSMARDGVDPAAFQPADRDGRTAYNASLDAAGPALLRPWLLDQVLPRLHPGTVVLAVSSIDLNVNGPAAGAAVAAYTSSPAGRDDDLGRLDRWLGDHSALVAHRLTLRDPGLVAEAVRGADPPSAVAVDDRGRPVLPGVLGPGGEGLSRRALHHTGPGPATVFARDQLLADFSLGQDPTGELVDLVEDLEAEDVEVVLLVLPVTADFAALHPGGRSDLEAAHDVVVEAAHTTGVPLVDLLDVGWPVELFADTHHLNGEGATRLSAELPDRMRAAGAHLPPCSGPGS